MDHDRVFVLIAGELEQRPGRVRELLSARLVLGLWSQKAVGAAAARMPGVARAYIGQSPRRARQYFWDSCDAFCLPLNSLVPRTQRRRNDGTGIEEGEVLVRDARALGKRVLVWPVNLPDELSQAVSLGVTAVMTDRTRDVAHALRELARG